MLETKEQKQIFTGCIILVLILVAVSWWHSPNFNYTDTTNYQALEQKSDQEQQVYAQYLASLGTTPEAQAAMLSQILPQSEIQDMVQQELDSTATVTVPTLPDSQIKISSSSGKAAVQSYLAQSSPVAEQLKSATDADLDNIYNPGGDPNQINSLVKDAGVALAQYQKIEVPKEAVDLDKQLVLGLQTYIDLLNSSKAYMADSTTDPWPEVYKDYAITDQVTAAGDAQFNQLNQKYNLLADSANSNLASSGNWLVPEASAQLATIDVWQKAEDALREAAAQSIARFMLSFMDQLANKIEQTYRISNFLYYSDALVSGQYVDDYLNKYVSNPVDRQLAKNLIPEVSCGQNTNNSAAFQAKANQYLGFDPSSLNPNDPQFYQKMAKVGDFFSSPQGWDIYYQGVAANAQTAAQNAANNEINSSGQKAGRNSSGAVVTPPTVSAAALSAIFQRYASEGSDTSSFTVVQQITAQIAQNFLNNFVLTGVVLLEQKACIATPQEQLVTKIP